MNTIYPPEVAKLLTYGIAVGLDKSDYVHELGIGEEHINALIKMATDLELHAIETEIPEAAAPYHAMHALGQLRAVPAVRPLLDVLERTRGDGPILEIPRMIGMIGRAAIPIIADWIADELGRLSTPVTDFDADDSRVSYVTHGVTRSLVEVSKQTPDATEAVVTLLIKWLEKYEENHFIASATIVQALCMLGAKQALPLITEVYLRQRADVTTFEWDQVLDAFHIDEDDEAVEEHARWVERGRPHLYRI